MVWDDYDGDGMWPGEHEHETPEPPKPTSRYVQGVWTTESEGYATIETARTSHLVNMANLTYNRLSPFYDWPVINPSKRFKDEVARYIFLDEDRVPRSTKFLVSLIHEALQRPDLTPGDKIRIWKIHDQVKAKGVYMLPELNPDIETAPYGAAVLGGKQKQPRKGDMVLGGTHGQTPN